MPTPNVNTHALLAVELNRHPLASTLTPLQKQAVVEHAAQSTRIAGSDHSADLSNSINQVVYGIPPVSRPQR
jgi:hypothetical protein